MKRWGLTLAFVPVLLLWGVVAVPFTLRTPDPSYSHDFWDHVQYTQFLHREKRLPFPGEGGEGHQPPLYYLIASQMAFSTVHHVLWVRLFSVALGALALWLMFATLQAFEVKTTFSLLALMFIATTPHFLFVFSSYNNDALVIFWGMSQWALFIRYIQKPSRDKALALGALTLVGFFTKFSFGAVLASVGITALYARQRGLLPARAFRELILVQLLALPAVLAWMYFHNVQSSGHWLALNHLNVPLQRLPHSPLTTILMPPGFTTWEWMTPFADAFLPIGKKNSLTAYALVTSIFGEYSFMQFKDFWIWFIFWVHTVWLAAALVQIRRIPLSKLWGWALAVGWLALAGFVMTTPFGSAMDFRHVAWLWLPLAVLQAQALQHLPSAWGRTGRALAFAGIGIAIVVQWALISGLS